MRANAIAVGTVAVVLGSMSSGCGKVADKLQEKAVEKVVESQTGGEGKLDVSGHTASYASKDGKMQGALGPAAKVPDGFPKQVPVYPGSSVVMANSDLSKKPFYQVWAKTLDPADKVVGFYKDKLASFKLLQDLDMGTGHMMQFGGDPQNPYQVGVQVQTQTEAQNKQTTLVAITAQAL